METIKFLIIILMLGLLTPAGGYILDVPPKPALADEDFIVPLEVEKMETKEIYQFVVLVSMLLVNMLVMYLMYLNAKKVDEKIKFDMQYFIYALFGVIIGYNWFVPNMTYSGTYLDVFFSSAAFALAGEGLVSKGAKAAKSVLKGNGNGGTAEPPK